MVSKIHKFLIYLSVATSLRLLWYLYFRFMVEFSEILQIISSYWEIVLLFFVVAILYASVGFGGGSSYLAILALTSLAFTQIRTTALICNIIVVSGGSIMYAKNNLYEWKKVVPLVLFSVPLAFVGGYLKISETFFFILLGCTLLIAALFMWISKFISETPTNKNFKPSIKRDASYGGIIGFISGMVGIGGGIFLAPLLHLTNWDTPKRIAATSSFFILVNSIAGLIGQLQSTNKTIEINWTIILVLGCTVFIGGQIGSRLSNYSISAITLKRATAILVAFVGVRILWKYLF